MSTVGAKPDLIFVVLVHQALRVDGARLVRTAADLGPDDRGGRLSRVHEFYRHYRGQLVAHHTHEDRLFFPALAARVGDDVMQRIELVSQHEQLDHVLEAIDDGFTALADPAGDFAARQATLTGDLSTMVERLTTHLDLEERTAIPLFESEITRAEYKQLEGEVRKSTSREHSSFMIPWLAEHASPDQRKAWFHTAPPLRVVYLLTRRRYRRLDEALLPCSMSGSSETRFTRSDGVDIAYQVVGEGMRDLLFIPGWVSHVGAPVAALRGGDE